MLSQDYPGREVQKSLKTQVSLPYSVPSGITGLEALQYLRGGTVLKTKLLPPFLSLYKLTNFGILHDYSHLR